MKITKSELKEIIREELLKESTDIFDYNELYMEQLISTVEANTKAWMRTPKIMEHEDTYVFVKRAIKTFDKLMTNLDRALRRLK